MTRTKKSISCFIMVLMMLIGIFSVTVSAAGIGVNARELDYFKSITDKNTESYPTVTVSLGGVRIEEPAYLIEDTTYIPLRAVSTTFGASVAFDERTRTAYVSSHGLSASVADGAYILLANERPLLAKTPAVILSDGRMYVPIRSIAKMLSLDVLWKPTREVELSGSPKPLTHADHYYNKDSLYWLSRIINAESRGETLLGQVAVGNVVLNRMRHKDYPNTIWGVIFDKRYGVQFSPVADGSIYLTPSYTSTLAAKICLEGVSVSDKILFFMEPSKSTSSWIYKNRPYAFTIGNHYFFY